MNARIMAIAAAVVAVGITLSACGDDTSSSVPATGESVAVPMNDPLVGVVTTSEVRELYRSALDAVNDPTPANAAKLRTILCYSSHRLPDGRPSWTTDFTSERPDRGIRSLDRVDALHGYFATVIERWTADPHGEADRHQLARRTVSAKVSSREDGSEGPCLLGLDTAVAWPYGSDTNRARDGS